MAWAATRCFVVLWVLVASAWAQHTEVTIEDTQTITGTKTINAAKVINGIQFADQWCGGSTDSGVCIANAIAALPSTGGIVYATNLPAGTAASTLTISKPVYLYLPAVTTTLQGAPGILVTNTAAGTFINGLGESATTLSCTTNSTNCVTWQAARGAMSNLTITTTQNATNGLVLDAPGAGQDVKFNYFWNLSITAPSTNTVDGVKLIASDATHKISFNHFENLEIIDYGNSAVHMSTSGTVGPTDNVIVGGQFRQTSQRGVGYQVDAASQDNSIVGGDISFYTTGINLAASATISDNKWFGTVPESNTNAVVIGAGPADNQFYGVPFGAQVFTDSGTRTVVQSGNNALGASGAAAQKQGAPFSSLTFVSSAGFPGIIAGSGSASRTYTFPDVAGNVDIIPGTTSQKAETGSADANVLTVTPAAVIGTYRACFVASVSSATAGVISWTLSWTDSSGNAQSNIAQDLFQDGTAAPATSFTTSAAGNYHFCRELDVNNAAANIVVKWVGGGTTAAKVSATIERLI